MAKRPSTRRTKTKTKKSRVVAKSAPTPAREDPLALPARIPNYWSASAWDAYAGDRGCPRRYLLARVKKYCVPPMPRAIERGITIHALAEAYLKREIRGLPDELSKFSREFAKLRSMRVTPEKSWTLTEDEQQCEPTDWDRAWLRAKLDAHHYFEDRDELLQIDFKTGRVNVKRAQGSLYAAMAPHYYPKVKRIHVEFWFLDHKDEDGHGVVETMEFSRREAEAEWRKWRKRAERMLSDRTFSPKPGKACDDCPYRSNSRLINGELGPCDAWRHR